MRTGLRKLVKEHTHGRDPVGFIKYGIFKCCFMVVPTLWVFYCDMPRFRCLLRSIELFIL